MESPLNRKAALRGSNSDRPILHSSTIYVKPFPLFLLVALLCLPPAAWSTHGTELIGVGAVQKGLGGAGVAVPYDATWVRLNPASIVDLERRFDIALELLRMKVEADIDGPLLVSDLQSAEPILVSLINPFAGSLTDTELFLIPSVALVWPWENNAFGFGLFGVRGNRVDFARPRSLVGMTNGHTDRRTHYEVVELPFSFAHRFSNGWSAGLALVGVVSRFRSDCLTAEVHTARADYDWDYALGIGFKLAVYKKWERLSFGAVYSSRQCMQRFDKYRDLLRFRFNHPQQVQVGLGFRATPRLQFLFDCKFTEWSGEHQTGNHTLRSGLGWRDQHIFKLGANYDLNEKWSLRTGLSYGRAPIPDDEVFSNVVFPANAETHLCAGCTYHLRPGREIHFAYMHAFEKALTDNGKGDLFSLGGGGTTTQIVEDSVVLQYSHAF